jgi:hypothetical protein
MWSAFRPLALSWNLWLLPGTVRQDLLDRIGRVISRHGVARTRLTTGAVRRFTSSGTSVVASIFARAMYCSGVHRWVHLLVRFAWPDQAQ